MNYKLLFAGSVAGSLAPQAMAANERPNVIIVLTDDQGIGGLSCHGNPWLKTPELDKLYAQSVRMTNFHVTPLSTPTRSSIITGRYPIRNGAWATFKGRDIVSKTSPTIADIFQSGGYNTALFGKWHLGDNYPMRPTDCGFDHSVSHMSGGVGELSDFWGNTYFDDTYFVNNEPTKFKGYCTDVWFEQAERYIESVRKDDKPFFVYLATNAPHSPHYVAEKYSAPYKHLDNEKTKPKKDVPGVSGFYGQIANLDENFGKLERYLEKANLVENTIVIFLTDNGAGFNNNIWVNGYSGAKQSPLDGGHRVPFFIRWPKGGLKGGVDREGLAASVDVIPTLANMCSIKIPTSAKLDGIDITKGIKGEAKLPTDRTVFIHHRQDSKQPFDVKNSCLMRDEWRLINGDRLYNIRTDKEQKHNIAAQHPEMVKSLLDANAEYIAQTKKMEEYREFIPIYAGCKGHKVSTLTIQHAMGTSPGLWESEQIAAGIKSLNNEYAVKFTEAGRYKISYARWPRECQGTIHGIPTENPKNWFKYTSIKPESAELFLNGTSYTQKITPKMKEVSFEVNCPKGTQMLKANFIEGGKAFGAYYIYIERL
ncbi:MAG: arylsulfatase [Rikenellaceae bacterium]